MAHRIRFACLILIALAATAPRCSWAASGAPLLSSEAATRAAAVSAPEMTAPVSVASASDQAVTIQADASDPDAGDILTISAAGYPASLAFSHVPSKSPATATLSGTLGAGDVGTHLIEWGVSDGTGRTASATTSLSVSQNQDPVLAAPQNVSGSETIHFEFSATVSDPDGDPVNALTASGLPAGASFIVSRSPFVTTATAADARLINNDVLPAANATYRFSESMNTRLGYSVTVSRPELREMSPFDMYDYETGYSEVGNPKIQATTIQNFDARWELYPGTRELLSVSAFRKVLFQPIESVVLGSSGGYILTPRNGRDGRVRGVELEARLGGSRIWDAAARLLPIAASPSALEHWAVSMNYSRVASSVRVQTRLDGNGNRFYREGPLQGQSSYSLNAGLYYGSGGMEGSLLLSSFGKRLAQVGAGASQTSLPDIFEHPPLTLDLTASRSIGPSVRLKISAENLLDRATEYRQLDQVTRRYRTGRTLALAMSLRG